MDKLKLLMNRNADKISRAMKIVEEFIADRRLVIYGGFAIDAALRMKDPGLAIYDDINLTYADYDFYSPNILVDAVDLASKIAGALSNRVDVLNAQHLRTLKIFWEGTNVADISYCPHDVFRRIQTLKYKTINDNIVLIVAPINQAIDIHSALEMPFMNPPREVIQHRIEKDVRRFNLLWDNYIAEERLKLHTKMDGHISMSIPIADCRGAMINGLMAYAYYMSLCTGKQTKQNKIEFAIGSENITAKIPIPRDYLRDDLSLVELFVDDSDGRKNAKYERLLDVFYRHDISDGKKKYYVDQNLWLAKRIDSSKDICVISIQGVLKNLLAHYIFHDSPAHFICYFELISLIDDDSSNADESNDTVWPSENAPNVSATVELWSAMTRANIDDRIGAKKRVLDRADMKAVTPLMNSRPPALSLSGGNINDAKLKFIEWNIKKSPYFSVDERALH